MLRLTVFEEVTDVNMVNGANIQFYIQNDLELIQT